MTDSIQRRKAEHLDLAAGGDSGARLAAGWHDVALRPAALPEIDVDQIDCSQLLLGRRLRFPLVIAGMTGGFDRGAEVNAVLAEAAEAFGVAMGVGSQRAALSDAGPVRSYAIARRLAPTALLIANVGAPQLIAQDEARALSLAAVHHAIDMIGADALAVHLNYLQELVQPEGDHRARGCAEAMARLSAELPVPVIAMETGAGMTRECALALRACGVAAIDVGGRGGTSFAAVEGMRAAGLGDMRHARLGELFRDWGIPTPVAVLEAVPVGLPVIATGGVRTGLDAARAIALGATAVGVARPLAQAALQGRSAVERWLRRFLDELRVAMFLTGSRTLAELRANRPLVLGQTREWVRQLAEATKASDRI